MSVSDFSTLTPPAMLSGMRQIADEYDAFILDIFGVLHDGIQAFPGTVECLEQMRDAGKQVCLLSNSPRRTEGAAAQMEMMGIGRDLYDHIVTSGEATYQALKNRDASTGDDCWFIGNDYGSEITEGMGLRVLNGPEDARFILNSIPGTEARIVELLRQQLELAASRNLPMICANPDLVVNIGSVQYECAGTFAAYYEELGGEVIYHGKPHAPVYEMCYAVLGQPDKSKICAVGDSFHTDIRGANNFGIDSVMNLVGIHWDEILSDGRIDPQKMRDMLDRAETHPRAMIAGFEW